MVFARDLGVEDSGNRVCQLSKEHRELLATEIQSCACSSEVGEIGSLEQIGTAQINHGFAGGAYFGNHRLVRR